MSDSTIQTTATDPTTTGTTKPKVVPTLTDKTSDQAVASTSGAATNGRAGSFVPNEVGVRVPIPLRSNRQPDPSASTPVNANGAAAATLSSPMDSMPSALRASIPNVMAPDPAQSPSEPETQEETVEEQVSRLRPRTIGMQWRFFRTLVFAFWLFGRLIFWQAYIFQYFPDWVMKRNNKRWTKYAREFRKFAIEMGGVQIKAGQFASTRADVLPEEVIAELAGLQDRVPTIPYKKIKAVLDRELSDLGLRYAWIDEKPVAAASLGQVHRAQLKSKDGVEGDRVVVKVQRPNVRDIVYTDMTALFIIARVAMRFRFISRRADAVLLVEEFGRVLLEEVSYDKEAENAERFKEMFKDDMGVYVPSIYHEHSTDQILTIEDVTSIKIDDYEKLAAAGIDRKDVATRLMDTYMQQIFEDRFFHADPHPGNLFIYPLPVEDESVYLEQGGGRPFYLIFIDFGMTGTLTKEIVQGLVNTLTAVITRDSKKLVASYQDIGFLLPGADTKRIEEATDLVFNEVWGMSMTDMTSMDFERVQNVGKDFGDLLYDMPFRVPQDFVYLGRTVSILGGMATALDPEFNPWTEIQKNVQQLIVSDQDANIFGEFSKIIQDSLDEIVANGPQGIVAVTERILNQFRRVNRTEELLQKIVDGDIAVATKLSTPHRRQLERIELQGKRTSRAFIFGTFMITSTLLYTNGDLTIAAVGYTISGVVFVSMIFARQ